MNTILYYAFIILAHVPWILLGGGAWIKWRLRNARLIRLQLEGAAILFVGTLAGWLVFDPNFGLDAYKTEDWSMWFERGATGAFWIGLLFFFLGFYLERKPRRNMKPWPAVEKAVALFSIIGAGVLAFFANRQLGPESFVDVPWPLSRMLFTYGFLPFAISYLRAALRHDVAPPDAFGFDED
jgi:hypothetical protein